MYIYIPLIDTHPPVMGHSIRGEAMTPSFCPRATS